MKVVAPREEKAERGGRGEARRDATEWPRVPLKQVCEINPRRAPSIPVGDDDAVSFVPMPAVDGDHGIIAQRLERPFQEVKKGYTYFQNGDVIFAKITPCMQNGKHAVCRDLLHGFGFGSTEFHVLRPGPRVRAEWVHGFLRQPELLQEAAEHFTGAVGQQRLPEDYLGELEIPLPPLAEQERIAGRLTEQLGAVERARAAAAQRLAAAEALPAALLRDVFDGPQASGWETRTIDDFAKTCSGATPSRGNAAYFGGGIPWVKTGELRDGFVGDDGSTEESVTEAALRDCSLPLLPPGTLLIAMYGQGKTRGRTGILTREATTNQACFAILPDPEVFDTGFLQLWFRANYHDLRAMTENRGGNQPNLNGVLLRELEIPMPDAPTQRRLAAELTQKLAAAEGVIARCREELAAIEALPAALLRDAFGSPRDPSEQPAPVNGGMS